MITVTESASKYITTFLSDRGKGMGIRLRVTPAGCSGMSYLLEPVDDREDEDEVYTSHDVDVYVDSKSLLYLDGTEIDYVTKGLVGGFEFSNPNASAECGCGESFKVG